MRLAIVPPRASEFAGQYDILFGYITIVCVVMTIVIFAGVAFFALKYRRRNIHERPGLLHGSMKLEVIWSVIPLIVFLSMFAWGAALYFDYYIIPKDAIEIYAVGKQWMWKIQYPEGQHEINELHVPVGRNVHVTLASEDVIHSFFIPAFRMKRDVVPGHYNTIWFRPTKKGRYHLFCAEYCGTQHSGMIGWVTVMDPMEYENWLQGGGTAGSMSSQGEKMFQQLGCSTCHLLDEQGRCPNLRNVYGNAVRLDDGRTVIADEAYLRESILNPNAKVVEGFAHDIMPTFEGQVSEESLLQLIAYIKSLSKNPTGTIGAAQTGRVSGQGRFGVRGTPGNANAGTTGAGPAGPTPVTEKGPPQR
jgi:cytochrome c oxidase subunit 2